MRTAERTVSDVLIAGTVLSESRVNLHMRELLLT